MHVEVGSLMSSVSRRKGGRTEVDRRHLELHGGTYRVVLTVPERVRGIVGISRFRHDLGTADLRMANVAKKAYLAEYRTRIDDALDRIGESRKAREIAACRAVLEDYRLYPDRYTAEEIDLITVRLRDMVDGAEGLGAIEAPIRPAPTETALAAMHDAYIAAQEDRLAPSTMAGDREAIRWLLRWLHDEGISPSIESMTADRCRSFAEALPTFAGVSSATSSRMLSRLSACWRWLGRKGVVESNPWTELASAMRRSNLVD